MKRITCLTGIIAIFLVPLSESKVLAGVVIAETMVSSDPIGGSQLQTRTVYTQGDKRKVEERGIDVITDLDRDVLFVVDKNQKEYAEVPLQALAMPGPGYDGSTLETIHFHGTIIGRCGLSQSYHAENTAGLSRLSCDVRTAERL